MAPKFRHLILTGAALVAAPASAQRFHDIEDLEQRVIAALGAHIGEPGGPARPIDRRLRLAACPQPVSVEGPTLSAMVVRCEPLNWRIRVPVAHDASTASANVGETPVRTARSAPRDYVVRQGEPVALVVTTGSFTVSRQAVAEQDGAPGDRIRVRTEARTAPVVGRVLPDGRVALTGFNGS